MSPVARAWITIAETPRYQAEAGKLLSEEEQQAVTEMIARDPTCGEVMEGTGGVRKVRFALSGRGKSGGARVIYYFHSDVMPAYLLSIFGKNQKGNLTKAERNTLARLVEMLKHAHGR